MATKQSADEKKRINALDKIDAIVGTPSIQALNPKELCKKYMNIRKYLTMILPLVAKIPVVGAKIAAAITFLMAIADAVCPTV